MHARIYLRIQFLHGNTLHPHDTMHDDPHEYPQEELLQLLSQTCILRVTLTPTGIGIRVYRDISCIVLIWNWPCSLPSHISNVCIYLLERYRMRLHHAETH